MIKVKKENLNLLIDNRKGDYLLCNSANNKNNRISFEVKIASVCNKMNIFFTMTYFETQQSKIKNTDYSELTIL